MLRSVRIGLAFSAEALAGFLAAFGAALEAADFAAAALVAGASLIVVFVAVFAIGSSSQITMGIPVRVIWTVLPT
jgi:hypothetical protein